MIGKILSLVLGALSSRTANATVGVANVGGWLVLAPLIGYAWHYRDTILTLQISVGAAAAVAGVGYFVVSAIVEVARRSAPPPAWRPPGMGE